MEKVIVLIRSRVRAIFDTTGITGELRNKLWTKAMSTVIDWYNVSVRAEKNNYSDQIQNGKVPVWTKRLKIFDKIGVIRKIEKQKNWIQKKQIE